MHIITTRLVATAALCLAAFAPRVTHAQIEPGDSQLTLQGSLSKSVTKVGDGSTSGSFGGSYGYFLTRQIAVRGTAFLTASGGGTDEFGNAAGGTSFFGAYGGGLELNLGGAGQKFVPYLAFDVLTVSGQQQELNSVILGPAFGARAFISRSTAFDMSMRYETTSDDTSVGTLRTNFGFSVFFGSNRR